MRAIALVVLALLILGVGNALAAGPSGDLSLGLGLDKLGDQWYLRAVARPDLSIGKLGIGLDVVLRFDEEGIRTEDWDDWSQALGDMIRYVSWGRKGDELYIRAGVLESAILGSGILMADYSNLTPDDYELSRKRTGLILDANANEAGIETVVGNLLSPGLIGVRSYIRPLYALGLDIPALNALQVGGTIISERRYEEAPGASAVDVSLPLTGWAIPYTEYAVIADKGSAFSAGVRSNASDIISYRAEYRIVGEGFVTNMYGSSYETLAAAAWDEGMGFEAAFEPATQKTDGYLVEVKAGSPYRPLFAVIRYESNRDESGEFADPTLSASLALDEDVLSQVLGRRASASAYYTQHHFTSLLDLQNERSRAGVNISIAVSGNLLLNYAYRLTFTRDGAPLRSMSADLSYGWSF